MLLLLRGGSRLRFEPRTGGLYCTEMQRSTIHIPPDLLRCCWVISSTVSVCSPIYQVTVNIWILALRSAQWPTCCPQYLRNEDVCLLNIVPIGLLFCSAVPSIVQLTPWITILYTRYFGSAIRSCQIEKLFSSGGKECKSFQGRKPWVRKETSPNKGKCSLKRTVSWNFCSKDSTWVPYEQG